jgi:hypothetical protein
MFNRDEMEAEFFARATPSQACREYARNVGCDRPESAWILTDYDTWEPNPYYTGPPVSHPEDFDPTDYEDPTDYRMPAIGENEEEVPTGDDDVPF